MKIAMLILVTLGYYGILFFLNKRRKTAFEKNAVTVLGDITNLDATEDATETDLFGKVNNNVDADTLSELTGLLDADHELASNLTNMIEGTEVEEDAPAITPIQKPDLIQALEDLENQDDLIEESDIDGLMSNIISKQ